MNDLDQLVQAAQADFAAAATPAQLEDAKARYTGKTGQVTELLKGMAKLTPEEKKTRGAAINETKQRIEAALTARRQALAEAELQAQLKAEALLQLLRSFREVLGALRRRCTLIELLRGEGRLAVQAVRLAREAGTDERAGALELLSAAPGGGRQVPREIVRDHPVHRALLGTGEPRGKHR